MCVCGRSEGCDLDLRAEMLWRSLLAFEVKTERMLLRYTRLILRPLDRPASCTTSSERVSFSSAKERRLVGREYARLHCHFRVGGVKRLRVAVVPVALQYGKRHRRPDLAACAMTFDAAAETEEDGAKETETTDGDQGNYRC